MRPRGAALLRRPARAGLRGQAAVIVALMLVALVGIVGIALDGGMEAANYRQAQNSADAAAANAARWVYNYITTNHAVPTQAQVQVQVDQYLAQNRGTPGLATLQLGGRPGSGRARVASAASGALGYTLAAASSPTTTSASSTTDLGNVSVGTNLTAASASTQVLAGNATASIATSPSTTASALAQVANVQTTTTTLGVTTTTTATVLSVQSTATPAATSGQGATAGSSSSTSYGALGSQSTQASVNAAGVPAALTRQVVVNATTGAVAVPVLGGATSVAATQLVEGSTVLGGGGPSVDSSVVADNLTFVLPGGVTITAPVITYDLKITGTYTATTSSTTSGQTTTTTTTSSLTLTATPTCAPATLTVAVGAQNYSVPVTSGCEAAVPAALTTALGAIGVSLGFDVLSPAAGACSAGSTTCTVTGCFLQATVTVPASGAQVANVCSVQAKASLAVAGGGSTTSTTSGSSSSSTGSSSSSTTSSSSSSTSSFSSSSTTTSSSSSTSTYGGSTTYDGVLKPYSVTVVCHVPTPTYFLGLLGWRQTNPTAQATAQILTVSDISDDAFAASPYAIPDTGIAQDGAGGSYNLLAGTTVGPVNTNPIGHQFYLYGPSMLTNYPVMATAPSGWQGRVATTTTHSVSSTLTPITGVASGPSAFVSGGGYYVLPIIQPVTNIIEAYGVFAVVAGNAHVGTLVDSVPGSGYLPQATTSATQPWFDGRVPYGAVAIKLAP